MFAKKQPEYNSQESAMATRGRQETDKLRTNVEDQLNRLLAQLQDLETLKDELDDDEYEMTKSDTLDQLKSFQKTLEKMVSGDVTLVDHLGSVQLAIQAAVSNAFKTPEVIAMFAKKQPAQLRLKLNQLQKGNGYTNTDQALEILTALRRLGEELSGDESAFLSANMSQSMKDFEKITKDVKLSQADSVLSIAGNQIKNANK
eukprot:TRINITY_DN564_c0_g1_i1.p2 TRINITY_DN564_c0_g1~~TRINITY_DN564_c0_g1_i1.p2  ORF type:complete len:202 (+),score=115.00 TRINITY_DN564_c0_g1_i1:2-607(+)